MRLAIIAFLLGILICQQLVVLPEIQWVWLLLAIVVGLGIVSLYARSMRFFSWFSIFIILGFCWMYWTAADILAQQLPKEMQGQQVLVQGRIISIPIQGKFSTQFDLYTTHLTYQRQIYPFQGKVRLKWYFKPDEKPQIIEPDQLWQLSVKLKRPHSLVNFGVFDYSKYLFLQRIHATGSVSQAKSAQHQLLDDPRPYQLQTIRYQLLSNIRDSIHDLPYAGIILAMGLGERSLITTAQWQTFRQTGTSHLVAISGLHISSIAFAAFMLSKLLFRLFLSRIALRFPEIYFATAIALITVSIYVFLSGFSISAQRAFIMVLGFLIPNFVSRNLSLSHRISLALAFVLLYDPLSPLSAGFWLSFTIVSIIIYFAQFIHFPQKKQNWPKFILYSFFCLLTFQFIISLINYPLSYYFFQQSTLLGSMLSNLMMIPIVSFIILPLILIGVLSSLIFEFIAFGLFFIVSSIFSFLFNQLDSIIQLEQWFIIHLDSMDLIAENLNLWTVLLTIISVFFLFAPKGFLMRWIGLIGLLPLFFNLSATKPINYAEFELTMLDVGQNLAIAIKTQNHQIMYDTANHWTASKTVIPYLKAHKINQLDLIIASHGDSDHIGGVNQIAKQIQIQQILTGATEIKRIQEFLQQPLKQGVKIAKCQRGQKWQWDGVQFEILHPKATDRLGNRNDRSCVLKVEGIQGSVLLTGDISSFVEAILMHQQKSKLNADILIVPHHGSKTSSSFNFIKAVNPKVAIFSTGYLNHFRHPHPTILKRYQHVQTFNTPETGAIRFDPNADNFLRPVLARETMQRIWHNMD